MNLREVQKQADFIGKNGIVFNCDCMELMDKLNVSERERERERE